MCLRKKSLSYLLAVFKKLILCHTESLCLKNETTVFGTFFNFWTLFSTFWHLDTFGEFSGQKVSIKGEINFLSTVNQHKKRIFFLNTISKCDKEIISQTQ